MQRSWVSFLFSYIFLGVLGTLWFAYQTVTLVLTAQSLLASNHEVLGSLTIVFMILPSFVMAVLWCTVQEGSSKGPRTVFDAIASGFRTVRTDLRSGFPKLRRMSIARCMVVSVTMSVLSLVFILLVLFVGSLFCVLLIVLIPVAVVCGVFMDTYLVLQGALSPCDLALDSKYASRYRNLRGLVDICVHVIPQTVLQVILLIVNVIPMYKVILSFIGVVVVIPYTSSVFYVRARYFCRQRGMSNSSLRVYLLDEILKPLGFIPNDENEIVFWGRRKAPDSGSRHERSEHRVTFFRPRCSPTTEIEQGEIITPEHGVADEIIPDNTVLPIEVIVDDGDLLNNISVPPPREEAERDVGSKELSNE